ncbi:hypothetical protein HYT25_02315 [Candidatus Pacearchaeota archaeon]|nr:hypothetical protein [Candidatus Pacearchaeota archaeon]
MKSGVVLLLTLIFTMFLSIGVFATGESCSIQSTACTDTGSDYELMRVSDLTNAHGATTEASPSGYKYVCCNFAGGNAACSGTNKVIGLSSATNAHAEIPSGTAYTILANFVCYGDLECVDSNDPEYAPDKYPIPVLSLSAETNAHIGAINDYGVKIYCTSSSLITSAIWSKNGVTSVSTIDVVPDTTKIWMILKNSNLPQGTQITFEIKERDDTLTADDLIKTVTVQTGADERANYEWLITQIDLDKGHPLLEALVEDYDEMEFYFEASNAGNSLATSGDLKIGTVLTAGFCDDKFVCSDYGQAYCTDNDVCDVAEDSVPESSECSPPSFCFCEWDTSSSTCDSAFQTVNYDPTTGQESILGKCTIKASSSDPDGCGDGFISYSWTATWSGELLDKPASCEVDSKKLACPALVQLPFFNFYNLIISGILIALIYAIFNIIEKQKRKHKHKKK